MNLNTEKWLSDNLKINSISYARRTKSNYDASSNDESGFAHDKMYVHQANLSMLQKNSINTLSFHAHHYNREYDESGYLIGIKAKPH